MLKLSIFLVAATVATVACGGEQPPSSGLLISSELTGNWEIFLLDPESQILHQVTDEGPYALTPASFVEGLDVDATWSPENDRIALSSDRRNGFQLYVVDADGIEQIQLTSEFNNGEPAWSPDGSHIAFRSDRTGDV